MRSEDRRALPRIVHLIGDLHPGESQRMLLARVRGCAGYEHSVWTPQRKVCRGCDDLAGVLGATGARLHIGGKGGIASWVWFLGAIARARLMQPAIVHSCDGQTHLVAPHIASAGNAALILSKDGADDRKTPKQTEREVSLANEAAAVVASSEAAAAALRRAGRVLCPVHVVPSGIPPGPPGWSVLPEDGGSATILYVGRLHPAEGLADLIEAVWRLVAGGHDLRLQIQGDGPAEGALRAACARPPLAGRARVLTEADLRRFPRDRPPLRTPVLFVLPSRSAGPGVVLLEAMRLGLPIIATRVGGIPELVEDGRQGVLIPPRDAPALMDAIVRLLVDRDLRGRLGDAGPSRVALFGEERMCREWSRIYREVSDGRAVA